MIIYDEFDLGRFGVNSLSRNHKNVFGKGYLPQTAVNNGLN